MMVRIYFCRCYSICYHSSSSTSSASSFEFWSAFTKVLKRNKFPWEQHLCWHQTQSYSCNCSMFGDDKTPNTVFIVTVFIYRLADCKYKPKIFLKQIFLCKSWNVIWIPKYINNIKNAHKQWYKIVRAMKFKL